MALVYAVVFFLADFGSDIIAGKAHLMFASKLTSIPAVVSITAAVALYVVVRARLVPQHLLLDLGLVFLVLSSLGIAFAQYGSLYRPGPIADQNLQYFGLSWIAPWVLAYAVVVPNTPLKTTVAAVLAGGSLAVTAVVSAWVYGEEIGLSPSLFFLHLVFPYLLVAFIAHASVRVIYRLGREVKRAQQMGSYRLVNRIGEGGMGEVWLARHGMLARPAAVKLIRLEAPQASFESAEQARRRFEREAKATALLRSPHTVEVYDFGKSEDGSLYFVMEYLDGMDLERLVSRFGPLPAGRAIHLLRQACLSLAEAHGKGLLHRDVKPANVFVARMGTSTDVVKVVDFGLVKTQAGGTSDLKLTADGITAGTPAYIAPEMVVSGPVDHRADLYCLGLVGYWLLTGCLVFERDSGVKVLVAHAHDEPSPPSAVCELPIPADLESVVMDCLRKSPDERPASAAELSHRLAACESAGSWTSDRAARWWDSHLPPGTS
jgi:serine/threonine-protein kinase